MGRSSSRRDRHRRRLRAAGGACGICGDPIDYSLPYLHPREFVVDHIVALAKGGPDTPDNTQAAHRDCNRAKGAKDYAASIVRRSNTLD